MDFRINNKIKDYDKEISNILLEWQSTSANNELLFRKATSFLVAQVLYKFIRKEILNEKFEESSIQLFLSKTKDVLKKSIWYFLWTFKWLFLAFRFTNLNVIICSFISDKKLSYLYLKEILKLKTDYSVLHFSVVYSFDLLFQKDFYCFPFFWFKLKGKIKYRKKYSEHKKSLDELENIVIRKFGIKIPLNEIESYLYNLQFVKKVFGDLLKIVGDRNRIEYFIQDIDYLGTGIIFYSECKSNNVKCISVDHSIKIYRHLFNEKYTDIYLAWGKFGELAKGNSSIESYIIGKPTFNHLIIGEEHHKYWLYILSAYGNPIIQTINRSLEGSFKIIDRLILYLKSKSDVTLLIKVHPTNNFIQRLYPQYSYVKNIEQIIPSTGIIFTEDTTLTIELLKYPVKLVYVTDRIKNDPFDIKNSKEILFYHESESIEELIPKINLSQIDMIKRMELFEYYFSNKYIFSEYLQRL